MKKVAGVVLLGALATGCATGPKFSEIEGKIPAVSSTEGRIYIYRDSMLGAAIQPDVRINGEVVGGSKPNGFYFLDRAPGNYSIATTTEAGDKTLTLTLAPAEEKFVRLNIAMGLLAGRVYPELVDPVEGQAKIRELNYAGPDLK